MVAPRAIWKGYLTLGVVSCGVKLVGATSEAGKIHFRILNRNDRQPVKSAYLDEATGEIVGPEDQVKGYEIKANEYLVIDPEDVKALKAHTEHTLDIDGFVEAGAIDQIYRDKPYYVLPADKGAEEAFAVIREALRARNKAAIGCVVLYQKTHHVIIEPAGEGMMMTTLRYERQIVEAKGVFAGLAKIKVDPEMADIAGLIIDRKKASFDPSRFEDRYEDALAALIEAKRSGKKPPKPAPKPKENVVNLMDVLKKSLAQQGKPARSGKARKKSAA
jgi:DNA end-binding protein Ku